MFMLQRYTFSMIKTSKLHTFSMITNVKSYIFFDDKVVKRQIYTRFFLKKVNGKC